MGALAIVFSGFSIEANLKNPRIVAWDIHEVLCTKPVGHGWQCEPNLETFAIVQELSKQGIKQVIFSNISRQSFCKLKKRYPELFRHFDLSRSTAKAEGIFSRKPHGKYIKRFLKRANALSGDILFFDDKLKNIESASKRGIDAHQFKNAHQARALLKKKNLL